MTTKKIKDYPRPCSHPEHNPPAFMVYRAGLYVHTCPACGHRQVFSVRGVSV